MLGPLYHVISCCLPNVINVQLSYNEKPQHHSKPPWRFLLMYLHLPCVAFAFELTHLSTLRPSQRVTLLEPSQALSDGLKLRAEPFNHCSSAVPLHMVFRWGNWKKAPRIGHYSEWELLRGGKKKKKDRDPSSLGHVVQQRACVCIMCLICTYKCTNLIHIRTTVTSHTPTNK